MTKLAPPRKRGQGEKDRSKGAACRAVKKRNGSISKGQGRKKVGPAKNQTKKMYTPECGRRKKAAPGVSAMGRRRKGE